MSAPDPHDEPRVIRQLRHDVYDVYGLVDNTNRTVAAIASTQRRHSTQLEEIQQSLDHQSGRLDGLDGRLDEQGGRLDRLDGRLDEQGGRLDRLDGRLDGLDGRLDGLDGRLDEQGGRLERMEGVQLQILDLLRTGRATDGPGSPAE